MRTRSRCLLAFFLVTAASGALGAADGTPDLSGHWEMDPELTEDPIEKMRLDRGEGPGRGGPAGRLGDGFRGGPGRQGGPGQPSPEEMRQRMEEMRRGLERLHIVQSASRLRIGFADGREHELATDNRWRTVAAPFGEMEVKARWQGGALVLRKRGRQGQSTETYYLTSDGSLLTVVVEMEAPGPRGSVLFKRIYRPYDPEAAAAPPGPLR